MARDTKIALNIEVKIPNTSTTAKPLIGPEPNIKRAKPATMVVILESSIVPQAIL